MAWRFIQALQLVSGKYIWNYGPYIDTIIEKINQGTWGESNLQISGISAPSGFVITGDENFGSGEYSVDETDLSDEYSTKRLTEYNGFLVEFPEYEGHPVGLGYKPSSSISNSSNYYETKNNKYYDSEHYQYVYTDRYLTTKWGDQSLKNEFGTAWNNGTLIGFSPDYVSNLANNPKELFGTTQDCYSHFPGDCSGMFFIADDENQYMQVVHFWTNKYWNGGSYELTWNWSAFAPSGSVVTQMNRIYTWLIGSETTPDPDPNDPYTGDTVDGSDQIGGRDVGDTPTDFGVTDVVVPTLSGLSTGFFTAYRMGESILDGLAQRLWNPTMWDSLKDKYRTPAEMIIGLYLLPVTSKEQIGSVPDPRHYYANNDSTESIALGGVTISGCSGHRVSQRWPTFKFGKVHINSRWDGYPDYKKFKNVKINLPFIGEQELDTNELMSKYENVTVGEGDNQVTRVEIVEGDTGCDLRLEYKIDVLTGTCVALIYVNDVLKYQFSGECSVTLPTTWQDSANVKSSFKSSLGAAIVTGIGAVGGFLIAGPAGAAAGGITGGAIGSKVTDNTRATGQGHTNGGFGSIAGPMQSNYPWVQITYPNVVVAENQDHFIGRAAPYTTTLGAAQGYVKCVDIHLENCTATDAEKAEILDILKEGVIV